MAMWPYQNIPLLGSSSKSFKSHGLHRSLNSHFSTLLLEAWLTIPYQNPSRAPGIRSPGVNQGHCGEERPSGSDRRPGLGICRALGWGSVWDVMSFIGLAYWLGIPSPLSWHESLERISQLLSRGVPGGLHEPKRDAWGMFSGHFSWSPLYDCCHPSCNETGTLPCIPDQTQKTRLREHWLKSTPHLPCSNSKSASPGVQAEAAQ